MVDYEHDAVNRNENYRKCHRNSKYDSKDLFIYQSTKLKKEAWEYQKSKSVQ